MSRKYLLRTLGCKVNQYESQQLREILESHGLRPARPSEVADLAVINSCAVTSSASAKTRQAVRRASSGGTIPTVVVGCGATADADRLRQISGVVGVWGHDQDLAQKVHDYIVHRLNLEPARDGAHAGAPGARSVSSGRDGRNDGWMSAGAPAAGERTEFADNPDSSVYHSIARRSGFVKLGWESAGPIRRFDHHERAFLKIQDGCDAFCTYCIIPRLRPHLQSKPVESAVAEAEALVRAGHREIVLTGIYLGAYGRTTAVRRRFERDRCPLAELVDAVAGVEGLARLRLSSLEPGDVTDELLDVLAAHDCCVPHLHLPLQSGSPRVLRKMNRQYTVDDFLAMIHRVGGVLDRPAISTDILVGFAGEAEDDFERTLEVARQVGFCKIHAFPYSPRDKTAASRWKNELVDGRLVRERMECLQQVELETALRFREQFVGSVERVLVERSRSDVRKVGQLCLHGRTDRYFPVYFEVDAGSQLRSSDIVYVRIDRVSPERVHGTLVATPTLDLGLSVLSGHGV
jgi:threonylcarbamoyladenosine tRNA methylthiotransferase MtaB